jgi:hypothetical protein
MRRTFLLLAGLLAVLALAAGCGSSSTTKSNTGTVRVSITDAPADYDSVILVIRQVSVHREGPDNTGWTSFVPDSSRYDLLRLSNGVFAEMGEVLVDAGHYTQVRLLLDPGSYVVENGIRRDIIIPSGMQTGLKLVGEFDVAAGMSVDLGIDFDAARSFHETGSGNLMLKPTCKVHVIDLTGVISGAVQPAEPASIVYAIAGTDTLGSAITGTAGEFKLTLLPAGSYTVAIDAPAAYRDTSLAGVGVTAGQVTSVGTVALQAQ